MSMDQMAQDFEIVTAEGLSDAQLCAAMVDAFSDYAVPMMLSVDDFRFMMRQRGFVPKTSRVAMIEGEIAAIWLTSVAGDKAYLISSGTRPGFRGRGLAGALGQAAFKAAVALGVRSYFTEVMDENIAAGALYQRLGMELARHVTCYDLAKIVGTERTAQIRRVSWGDIAGGVDALRDWAPTWQNSDAALSRVSDDLVTVAAQDDSGLCGYAALIVRSGVIAQFAVRRDQRRKRLARQMIVALQRAQPGRKLRVLNAQSDDAGFCQFMRNLGAVEGVGQRAMWIDLGDWTGTVS